MKLPTTSRSNNFKQLIYTDEKAIIESILLLVNTPIGRHQEDPNYGFDLSDLLFRVENSDELPELESEFENKVREYTQNQDINITFTFDKKNRTILVNVSIISKGRVINAPIKIDSRKGELIHKITLE